MSPIVLSIDDTQSSGRAEVPYVAIIIGVVLAAVAAFLAWALWPSRKNEGDGR